MMESVDERNSGSNGDNVGQEPVNPEKAVDVQVLDAEPEDGERIDGGDGGDDKNIESQARYHLKPPETPSENLRGNDEEEDRGNELMREEGDPNAPPWLAEVIGQGNCWTLVQVKLARTLRTIRTTPFIELRTGTIKGKRLVWAIAQSQGYRKYQEDRGVVGKKIKLRSGGPSSVATSAPLPSPVTPGASTISTTGSASTIGSKAGPKQSMLMFSVFDGHGQPGEGHKISEYCMKNMNRIVQRRFDEHARSFEDVDGIEEKQRLASVALGGSFRDVDKAVRETFPELGKYNGCTASCLFLSPSSVLIANLGDSRTVVYDQSENNKVVFATYDHKPTRSDEKARIQRAGGWVSDQRVNGDLAVSRAIGDFEHKPKGAPVRLCPVSYEPDVKVLDRNDGQLFVLATDGLWDAYSSKEVGDLLGYYLYLYKDSMGIRNALGRAIENLIRKTLVERLSSDNITVIVICSHDQEEQDTGEVADSDVELEETSKVEIEEDGVQNVKEKQVQLS